MRLIFVTQRVDAEDPILGATVAKLRALAERCDELIVITDRVGVHDLPDNCTLHTFGSRTRIGRGLRYMRALVPLLMSRRRPDALIAHMCPIYLVLAAPLAKIVRMPLAMWYTHWAIDWELRVATALADVALSVDRRSYPIDRPKVLGIGHGIDVAQFAGRDSAPPQNGTLRLLALGRTSPSKGFATLVRACGIAQREGLVLEVRIHGASTTDEERRHRGELEALIEAEDLVGAVTVGQAVPRPLVPELVRTADAVVNTTWSQPAGGALDKVVYEAAAVAFLSSPATRISTSFSATSRSNFSSRATTTPTSPACCTSSPAPTQTGGRRRVVSYDGGSRPATPSIAGQTQSWRRFVVCTTE